MAERKPSQSRIVHLAYRFDRPTIWKMLYNPPHARRAFYGKTELRPRRRITRRLRKARSVPDGERVTYTESEVVKLSREN